jgi:hypothetical protein
MNFTVSDTVKVVTLSATIIIGATTTTVAVRSLTVAVERLTTSLKEQDGRIDELERWKIAQEAYAQAKRELAGHDEVN